MNSLGSGSLGHVSAGIVYTPLNGATVAGQRFSVRVLILYDRLPILGTCINLVFCCARV